MGRLRFPFLPGGFLPPGLWIDGKFPCHIPGYTAEHAFWFLSVFGGFLPFKAWGPHLASLFGHQNPWSNLIKFKSTLENPRPPLTSVLHWLCSCLIYSNWQLSYHLCYLSSSIWYLIVFISTAFLYIWRRSSSCHTDLTRIRLCFSSAFWNVDHSCSNVCCINYL